jgi:RND family efflux transporter MFP subunit
MRASNRRAAAAAFAAGVLAAAILVATPLRAGEEPPLHKLRDLPVILVPHRKAMLSAEVESIVREIRKEMGEIFQEGEALVVLEDSAYRATLDKTSAQVKSAAAQLQSKENLLVDGGASVAEVETARMNLAVAKANKIIAERDLAACTIQAPFAGRVVKADHVNPHEYVQPGQELLEIVDDSVLRAQFLLPSTALARIRKGMPVRITVHETGETVPARISHIGAKVDPASSSVKVLAELDNEDRSLRGGMRGRLSFVADGADDAGQP